MTITGDATAYLEEAIPFTRLPDLAGAPPPSRCPLCYDPVSKTSIEHIAGDLSPNDITNVVAYTCGTGYAPGRTDFNADPVLWYLSAHYESLHPRRFLALFGSHYRDRLGLLDIETLPGMDHASLTTVWRDDDGPVGVELARPFVWSGHPFGLTLGETPVPPPSVCPACGESQRVPSAEAELETSPSVVHACLYACGSGYVRHDDGSERWKPWGGCWQPRPLAILAVARYWTWDEEPWALAVRDALRAAWLRNAHERLHIRL